jgi:hypothetical protein
MVPSLDPVSYRLDARAPPPTAGSPAALTGTAWSPRVELTVNDWVRQGRWLGALGRASGWWIGDWVRYGNARYGDRYGSAARVTGYDVQSLRNMAYVAGRFHPRRRRDGLSFSHHAELAGLRAEDQELWLDRAEVGTLSVASLRSELRRARHRAASRVARAEGRRGGDRSVPATRLSVPGKGGEVDPSTHPDTGTRAARATEGFGPIATEVVCPGCGRHFAIPDARV